MAKAIQVQNVSKQYRLGQIGTGSMAHDLNRWWHTVRGKEDPYLQIGETNDRSTKGSSDYVWSLKDIGFEIEQGDSVGIIGRNGAGKSTLLKILSRVTAPTTGSVKVKGRIASLLEVGTGFHPDLSGRDNIFLNGAILGMRKSEIKKKFDEIVDFAGVERYIDTPVKRYSSGMYVRLAFAVAAHLESEILIVDEVLAVGDAEFQKKCLGKMNDVSKGEGRTVLFVSHNMAAVSNLCRTGILMQQGTVIDYGNTREIIDNYIVTGKTSKGELSEDDIKVSTQNDCLKFKKIALVGKNGSSSSFGLDEDIFCEIEYEVLKETTAVPSIHLLNKYGECIFASFNSDSANLKHDQYSDKVLPKGIYKVNCAIPKFFLNDTQYSINAFLSTDISFQNMTVAEEILTFEVHETGNMRQEYIGSWIGQIRPKLEWNTIKLA